MISATTILETQYGAFKIRYHEFDSGAVVSLVRGNVSKIEPVIRIHSSCLFGETFCSLHCDCSDQLSQTLQLIAQEGHGAIIYSFQEGRGVGLKNKIHAMELQRTQGLDTVEAFEKMGYTVSDLRDFRLEVETLKELKVCSHIKLVSGSPGKISALNDAGFQISKFIRINSTELNELALKERETKIKKLGYEY